MLFTHICCACLMEVDGCSPAANSVLFPQSWRPASVAALISRTCIVSMAAVNWHDAVYKSGFFFSLHLLSPDRVIFIIAVHDPSKLTFIHIVITELRYLKNGHIQQK